MMISASSVCLALMTLGATGPDARVALVMEQRVDGRTVARSPAASALTERMIAAGVVFVDEAQARKIRSAIDAKTLVEGKVSQVVTSLDADLLVVGVADAQRRAGMFGKRVAYYETVIEARLLAVSTGRVLASLSVREKARSMEPERAVDKSARAAAETLAKQLLERMEQRQGAAADRAADLGASEYSPRGSDRTSAPEARGHQQGPGAGDLHKDQQARADVQQGRARDRL